jgi:hypothetical protein
VPCRNRIVRAALRSTPALFTRGAAYYRSAMRSDASLAPLRVLASLFSRRRVLTTLVISTLFGLLLSLGWESSTTGLLVRTASIGLVAMLVFGALGQWPRRLPRWLARWALQVVGVAAVIPCWVLAIYQWGTEPGQPPFWEDASRLSGFMTLTVLGILVAPWVAMSALLRQRDTLVRDQAVSFERERSALEHKAQEARVRLLQAQVEPHFLFNTLANIRALVEAGSPRAPRVLDSLIAYLRAVVPHLGRPNTTMNEELRLVRAYLEVMQMRMSDRLTFAIAADEAARSVECPPITLLTLVENAVRHGIDPGEAGGHIDVNVRVHDGRCVARVVDTGVGFRHMDDGLGTGLSTLRERLLLTFHGDAQLRVAEIEPHGVCAQIDFPATTDSA